MKRVLPLSLTMTASWLLVHSLGCHHKDSSPSFEDGGPIAGASIDVPLSSHPTSTTFEPTTPQTSGDTLVSTQTKPVFGGDNSLEKYGNSWGNNGGKSGSKAKSKGSSKSNGVVHVEEGTGSTLAGGDFGTFKPIKGHEDDDDGDHGYCGNRELEGDEQCDDGNLFNDDGCDNNCRLTDEDCTFYSSRYGTYVFCQDEKTWQDAHAFCLALGPYDLVTINNDPENSYLTGLINPPSNDDDDDDDEGGFEVWIGFNDLADEGYFVWSSGESSDYTHWNGGEPNNSGNEDCAELYSDSYWNDLSCAAGLYFICEAIFEGPVDE